MSRAERKRDNVNSIVLKLRASDVSQSSTALGRQLHEWSQEYCRWLYHRVLKHWKGDCMNEVRTIPKMIVSQSSGTFIAHLCQWLHGVTRGRSLLSNSEGNEVGTKERMRIVNPIYVNAQAKSYLSSDLQEYKSNKKREGLWNFSWHDNIKKEWSRAQGLGCWGLPIFKSTSLSHSGESPDTILNLSFKPHFKNSGFKEQGNIARCQLRRKRCQECSSAFS